MPDNDVPFDAAGAEVLARIGWIIRLRWVAIAGVFAMTAAAHFWLGVLPQPQPLYVIGLAMLVYNGGFQFLHWRSKSMPPLSAGWFAVSQMALDLVMLTLLIHFSGGIENPFIFYFVFHIILSSILLPRGIAYGLGVMACVLVGLMAVFEAGGLLGHYNLQGFLPDYVWEDPLYAVGIGFVFVTTLLVAAYLSSSTMTALRRRERELQEIRSRMVHQEKLAVMGQLAAGIAHEIGNPLASIAAMSEFLISELKDEQTVEGLKAIKEQTTRMSNIIRQVMNFARPATSEWHKVVVHDIIESALAVLKYDPRLKKVHVVKHFSPAVPPSYMMGQQMAQVFTNIFLNALDAMEGRDGRLTVRADVVEGRMAIMVEDTGAGMTPEALAHAFEPFFTTKPPGKGTGLGLAVSLGIVQQHGGTITVESEPGEGARFIIKLPIKTSLA